MRKEKTWKMLLALGLVLGMSELEAPFVVQAEQSLVYDDGQAHNEDHDFTGVSGEDIQISIKSGSTLTGGISGGTNNIDFQMDNGHHVGVFGTNIVESGTSGDVTLNMTNASTWDGDIQLNTTTNSNLNFTNQMTGSIFHGSIQGSNSMVAMDLQNSQWTGEISMASTVFDAPTDVNISLEDQSKWTGDLDFVNNGAVHISIDNSEWVGNFDKEVLAKLTDHLGSHFVNLEHGKWDGNYRLDIQADGVIPGYNQVNLNDHSEWNGHLNGNNLVSNENILNNQVVIGDGSIWNGNMGLSGNSVGMIYLNGGGKWNGNFEGTEISLSGVARSSIALYGNSTWSGLVNSNAENAPEVQLGSGSNWEMIGDSTIQALSLDETSRVDFSDGSLRRAGGFSTLTIIDTLSGVAGAQINLRTDLAQNIGDLLDVKGEVTGNFLVGVNNQGSASVDPSKELTIIKTGSSAEDAFALSNEVEVGGFKYMMKQEGTNWVLYSMDQSTVKSPLLTTAASGAINTLSAGYLLNYSENESVLKRAGELREGTADRNVWGRIYGGEYSSAATDYVGSYEMDYHGVQIGADKKIALKNEEDLYLGILGGYSKGSLDYKDGSGSIESKTIGIYGTYVAPSDFYSNLILKYGWTNSDFSVRDSAGEGVAGKGLKSDGFSSSLEVGKKVHFNKESKSGWYVEPQAQLTYGAQNGGRVTATNGLTVDLDGYHSLQGRLGMRAGYEVSSGKKPINVYGKLSYIHEFDGKMDVALNGINIREDLSDSWWNYGIGVTAKVGDRHKIYLEVEKSSGDRFEQKWGITGGYRISW